MIQTGVQFLQSLLVRRGFKFKGTTCLFLGLSAVLFTGCGVHRQTEDYHMQTIADLNVTADNHPHGYRKTECFVCHLPQNIHQEDRIHAASFSLAKAMVEAYGTSSCSGCHGSNGVTP